MQRVIGIDFGTSTTYMNVKRYSGSQPDGDKFSYMPVMFNYGESSGYVATIVRENADGSFDFGEKASEPLEGSRVHIEIKMRLESPDEAERTEARRITREFFKFLHEQYAQQAANLGGIDDQEETIISYPVKWQKETAQFMLDTAREAGFQNVRGMDEAEAAVATVLCQNSGGKGLIYADKPGYLMLIDMGAGTTDLVVCRYRASASGEILIELVTSWPHSADEPTFGGREIDAVLEGYVETYLSRALNPALAPQAHVIATAPGQAKMWKERNVSIALAADKPVNTCAYIGTYKTMGMLTEDFPAFGRKDFEKFAESGLRDYARLVNGCLKQTAEIDKSFSTLDLVILTGGHSAWYFAKEILTGAMAGWLDHPALAAVRENPYRVVSLPNPQTTVSLGLVYSKLPFKLEKKPEKKTEQKPEESVKSFAEGELRSRLISDIREVQRRASSTLSDEHLRKSADEKRVSAAGGAWADERTNGMHTLTLTRATQWAGAAVKLYVQVDYTETYVIGVGGTVKIPVSTKKHHLSMWFGGPAVNARWKAHFDVNVSRNMELLIKYSASTFGMKQMVTLYEGARIVGESKLKYE